MKIFWKKKISKSKIRKNVIFPYFPPFYTPYWVALYRVIRVSLSDFKYLYENVGRTVLVNRNWVKLTVKQSSLIVVCYKYSIRPTKSHPRRSAQIHAVTHIFPKRFACQYTRVTVSVVLRTPHCSVWFSFFFRFWRWVIHTQITWPWMTWHAGHRSFRRDQHL